MAHHDRPEGLHLLVAVHERVAAEVVAVVEFHPEVPEDRCEEVVVVPPDDDRLRPLLEEPEDLLDLHPLVREVLRELVLEVPRDDQPLGLVRVEEAGGPLQDLPPLEPGDRDPLLREGRLEPEVEVADRDRALPLEQEGEVAGHGHAGRDFDLVHRLSKQGRAIWTFGASAHLKIERKNRPGHTRAVGAGKGFEVVPWPLSGLEPPRAPLLEALLAVDRSCPIGLEGHLGLLSAIGANHVVHLPGPAVESPAAAASASVSVHFYSLTVSAPSGVDEGSHEV